MIIHKYHVTQALNKIKAIQPKLTEAINMLQNKENNTELVNAKNRLENAVNDTDPTRYDSRNN